jgi:predicted DNA-binding protein (UPF0251 family)
MVRPKLCRRVMFRGNFHYFKPQAVPLRELEETVLTVDEFEAVRLKDKLGLDQIEAAGKMDVSQPTFHRILESARKKIAEAIVDGKAIKIHGGACKMPNRDGTGPEGKGPRTGRGLGKCKPSDDEELDEARPRGLGPCGDGTPRGRGMGRGRR